MSRGLKVILVDDDPVSLEVTQATLKTLGHTVLTRDEALGTTAFVMEERPDLVVLDIQMPAISGSRLARVIRDRSLDRGDAPPRFILHSGLEASRLERLAKEVGALGGIEKSADPRAFADAFTRLTGRPDR